jgi:RNA polymerase sigma factor (sigma-70 family)
MAAYSDLEQLIGQAREHDKDAFRLIFELHSDKIFSYALSHTKERQVALDATQETFIALWLSLPSFSYQSEEAFLGFLFTILKRTLGKHFKAEKREVAKLQEEIFHEDEHEDYRYLFSLIEKISPLYQEAIRLRYWGSLSFAEIGATLGIDENTARMRHYRAIKELQDLF